MSRDDEATEIGNLNDRISKALKILENIDKVYCPIDGEEMNICSSKEWAFAHEIITIPFKESFAHFEKSRIEFGSHAGLIRYNVNKAILALMGSEESKGK